MANLYGQIVFAINRCFKEGTNKHSFKEENDKEMGYKIFSYEEKFRLKDVAKNFTNFLKEENMNIKQIKDVKSLHIQEFLNAKTEKCTQNTINSYASSIFKIENVCNKVYSSCNLNWRQEIAVPVAVRKQSSDRGVESVISREDYNKIIDYAERNPSQSGYCLLLQDFLGVRVEEIARIKLANINLENRTIVFTNTKGGRVITREIPIGKIGLMNEIISRRYGIGERLFSIKGSSINKYLNRIQDENNLARHSNHDIRRLIAQEKYNNYRENGLNMKEAIQKTSQWLNHGDNRKELLEKSYIKIW